MDSKHSLDDTALVAYLPNQTTVQMEIPKLHLSLLELESNVALWPLIFFWMWPRFISSPSSNGNKVLHHRVLSKYLICHTSKVGTMATHLYLDHLTTFDLISLTGHQIFLGFTQFGISLLYHPSAMGDFRIYCRGLTQNLVDIAGRRIWWDGRVAPFRCWWAQWNLISLLL